MITPEQQKAADEYLKSIGSTPQTPSKPSNKGWYAKVQSQMQQDPSPVPKLSFSERVEQEQVAGGKYAEEGAQQGIEATGKRDIGGMFGGAAKTVAGTFRSTVGAPMIAGTKLIMEKLVEAHPELATAFSEENMSPEGLAIKNKILQKIQEHPKLAEFTGNMTEIIGAFAGAEGLSGFKVKPFKGVAGDLGSDVKGLVTKTPEAKMIAQSNIEQQAIKDLISPKPTAKEAKLATEQDRLFKGKEPTTFKQGTPDQVAVSNQQADSIQTIHKLIPGASKMDEPTLYSALKEKIGETAKALKPEMQKTPLATETQSKMRSEWDVVKKNQADNVYTPSDVNIKKLQADFENRMMTREKGGADPLTIDDVWEARIGYDKSVPENVKRANSLSSESLLAKKDIWLQNRQILTNAINDSENGLGSVSRQSFKEMRDMYEAENGILSKAKIETTAEPSKFKEVWDSKTGKFIRTAAKVGVGEELIRRTLFR